MFKKQKAKDLSAEELTSYEDFKYHGYRFNLYFCVFTSILIACAINFILTLAAFYDDASKTWFVIVLSCIIPIIIYVAKSHDYGIQVAYYKRWLDSIHGILDRKKILKQFANTYGIKSWRKKVENIEPDGRWHFHANTNYVKTLASERDSVLGEIEKDFIEEDANVDRQINDASSSLENIRVEFQSKKDDEDEAARRLKVAKSSEEIYVQRRYFEQKKRIRVEAEQEVKKLEHEKNALQIKKNEFEKTRCNSREQVELIYDERYRRYAEFAVKTINNINGLKYDLEGMEK